MATNKRTKSAVESIAFVLLVGGILVAANGFFRYFNVGRVDVTENRLFSLSDGSERLVGDLDDKMEITAYFTADLPPPFNTTEQAVRDLLSGYEAASGGKIEVSFIDPDDEELQKQAEEDGVRRVSHQVIENDQVSVREGYRGLVIKYLGDKETLPVIQDTAGLEYTITMAIKKMVGEKRPVGIVAGHESPSLSEGLTRLTAALPTYDLREVTLDKEIDQDLAAVLVIGPETTLTETELRYLDQYVMRGGALGIFGGGIKLSLEGQEPGAEPVASGLDKLLEPWGVKMRSDIVADAQCQRAPMRGPMGLTVAVPYPPVPIVSFDEEQQEHPVLFRLGSAMMPFTSSLALKDAPSGVDVMTLAASSDNSWSMSGSDMDIRIRGPREWQMGSDGGPFPLLVAIEGKLPSAFAAAPVSSAEAETPSSIEAPAKAEKDVRVLVAGTSAFLRDEFMPPEGQGGQSQMSGSLSLALNAVDWLAADSDLIAIRAKDVEVPALDVPNAVLDAETDARSAAEQGDEEGVNEALEKSKSARASWDKKKNAYKFLNTLGIPFAFAFFGFVRWRMRVAKRKTLKL